MNKGLTDLSSAIFMMDEEKIIFALSKGTAINKSNTKKNTINFAIRELLNQPVDKFNIKCIEAIFNHGGIVCNARTHNNTLDMIIFCKMNDYINKAKLNNNGDMAKKNILVLLNFILLRGAVSHNSNILSDIMKNCQHGIELELVKLLCEHHPSFPDISQTAANSLNCAVKINNLELVRVLCQCQYQYQYKVLPNVSQNEHNTLTCAVKTKNLEIVKIICKSKAMPNISRSELNTLSCAVLTQNVEIVRIICENGGLSNSSTLNFAVRAKNPEIIREIIMRGGVPDITDGYLHRNTFDIFNDTICDYNTIEQFHRALNLLMCSGAWITYDARNRWRGDLDSRCKKKLISCYNLLQGKEIQTDEELRDKNELKKELIKTMKELMEDPVPKRTIVEQIDIGVQYRIPVPCVDMIYEYQYTESLVQFIDWSKY